MASLFKIKFAEFDSNKKCRPSACSLPARPGGRGLVCPQAFLVSGGPHLMAAAGWGYNSESSGATQAGGGTGSVTRLTLSVSVVV